MTSVLPEIASYYNINKSTFEAEVVPAGQPVILRSLVAEWPIVAAARKSDQALIAYLGQRANSRAGEIWVAEPKIEGRFGFNSALDGYNFDRKLASIGQLLDLLLRQKDDEHPWALYAGALLLSDHAPQLLTENLLPLLDPGRDMLVSLWLGNRTHTHAHWDLPQNLACVVSGKRRFTVFPPSAVENLYVGPLDFTLAGQPSSLADIDAPDFKRFPKLRAAYAVAQSAELTPGDVIYIPSMWWHAVDSFSAIGGLINYWWRDGPSHMMSPFRSLQHALLTMGDLPSPERRAWKALFDHYVFKETGDPAAHLPEPVRGMLGRPTRAMISQLKDFLIKSLQNQR
jgi:hypothetical protein